MVAGRIVKWTGHALPANGSRAGGLRVVPDTARVAQPLSVQEAGDAFTVTVDQTVGRSGEALIRSARVGSAEVMQSVRLLASAQDRADDAAQWGIAATAHLALIGDMLE